MSEFIWSNWREYPHPTIGHAKYIEFYKDSNDVAFKIQIISVFISFDLGSSWTLSMNGFAANDYPTYITLGKDQNFYAQIRDNIYKYSIKDNYWIWLFEYYLLRNAWMNMNFKGIRSWKYLFLLLFYALQTHINQQVIFKIQERRIIILPK